MAIATLFHSMVMSCWLLSSYQNPRLGAAESLRPLATRSSLSSSNRPNEWFRNWDMETRIAQSQLVLVVRVSNVSAVTVVQGAKVTTTHREYRFQPVRRLKGVFTRDELPMTSSDLGLTEGDGSVAPPVQQGEFRLLLLTRTAHGGFTCTGYQPGMAFNLEQIIPKLRGADDAIVGMAEALVRVTESPSRRERVELLVRQLDETDGPAVVPLMRSLGARAFWAANKPATVRSLLRLTRDDSNSIRAAALQTLERVLALGAPDDTNDEAELASLAAPFPRGRVESAGDEERGRDAASAANGVLEAGGIDDTKVLAEAAESLRRLLDSDDVETSVRESALLSIGHMNEFGRRLPWTAARLVRSLEEPLTHAERVAAVTALAELNDPKTADRLLAALTRLPLDEPVNREQVLIAAATSVAGDRAAPVLSRRLERKLAAEHYAAVEIAYLGYLKHQDAIPLLLRAAAVKSPYRAAQEAGCASAAVPGLAAYTGWDAFHQQLMATSYAFEQIKDPRAVSVLDESLHDPNQYVRARAFDALAAIDSAEAVAAVRLRFKAEPDLRLKLRMAALLGRHQIHDGYALAIEHAADPGLTDVAVQAIGAIREPRSASELWNILNTSHDPAWNGAALSGLVALRDPKITDRLFVILGNPRDPLLPTAVTAAGHLGDLNSLPLIAPLTRSRNEQVVQTALSAIAKLATPGKVGDDPIGREHLETVVTSVLTLVGDQDAGMQLRVAAFNVAKTLPDERVRDEFTRLAELSVLENTPLLPRLEQHLRRTAKGSGKTNPP